MTDKATNTEILKEQIENVKDTLKDLDKIQQAPPVITYSKRLNKYFIFYNNRVMCCNSFAISDLPKNASEENINFLIASAYFNHQNMENITNIELDDYLNELATVKEKNTESTETIKITENKTT